MNLQTIVNIVRFVKSNLKGINVSNFKKFQKEQSRYLKFEKHDYENMNMQQFKNEEEAHAFLWRYLCKHFRDRHGNVVYVDINMIRVKNFYIRRVANSAVNMGDANFVDNISYIVRFLVQY